MLGSKFTYKLGTASRLRNSTLLDGSRSYFRSHGRCWTTLFVCLFVTSLRSEYRVNRKDCSSCTTSPRPGLTLPTFNFSLLTKFLVSARFVWSGFARSSFTHVQGTQRRRAAGTHTVSCGKCWAMHAPPTWYQVFPGSVEYQAVPAGTHTEAHDRSVVVN